MSLIDLTSSQKTILYALTNLYRQTADPIRGEDIAAEINRNTGTIRNQMQSLKALHLSRVFLAPKEAISRPQTRMRYLILSEWTTKRLFD
jgi:predicted transcriptional regulator